MNPDYFGDFDDLFERMSRGRWIDPIGRDGSDDLAVDVTHADDEIVVTADVPGFESGDLNVSVDDDLLTIRAESGADEAADDGTYVRRERRHRAMRRTIRLPAPVDADAASATYRNGVLAVRLPAVADADVRHIDVE
jgi:HSP20 family protein